MNTDALFDAIAKHNFLSHCRDYTACIPSENLITAVFAIIWCGYLLLTVGTTVVFITLKFVGKENRIRPYQKPM